MPPEPGLPRRHDEHVSLPTWRVRQLQEIEFAARVVLDAKDRAILDFDDERWSLLRDALERAEHAMEL